jgi:hypothetical protein
MGDVLAGVLSGEPDEHPAAALTNTQTDSEPNSYQLRLGANNRTLGPFSRTWWCAAP